MYIAAIIGVIAALAVVGAVWGIGVYNRLISQRSLKEEGWSGVDAQLKRRHELVGNIVSAARGYLQHDKAVLEEAASRRLLAQGADGVVASAVAETGLNQALGRLFAAMEGQPGFRADKNLMRLQAALSGQEEDIQAARRYYNATVRDLNLIIHSFPSSIIARRCGFQEGEFFEMDNVREKEAPRL